MQITYLLLKTITLNGIFIAANTDTHLKKSESELDNG